MKGESFPLPKKGWCAANGSRGSAVCRWIEIFLPSAWSGDQALTQIFLRFTTCMFKLPDGRVLRSVLGLRFFTTTVWNRMPSPWTYRSVLNMSLGRVMGWRLMFGEAFRSECFELWIAKGASRCLKRGHCWCAAARLVMCNGPFSNLCGPSTLTVP